ncbi:hypothetical protein [Halorubrum ezzemoulense]|uniref:hypothetical protein n=1 Tax=Halorubrum ezzemoulense TaxID=337243 RepID=UPI0015C67795|nr:hypothetical protein [Halorubrum ezzemoulense]
MTGDNLVTDLDLLVGQPVQLIHDLVDKLVRLLDLRVELLSDLPCVQDATDS